MKIYRIQDPVSKEFLDKKYRRFSDDPTEGSLFFTAKDAKKAMAYQITYSKRYIAYYNGNTQWAIDSRKMWEDRIAQTNRAEIVEYDLTESSRLTNQGSLKKNTETQDESIQTDHVAQLEKIDFTKI